ncbi:DUF4082 domain-containing protein [Glutamicibacter arilaitensis]|uniref:DUF4082 domain-containing protein n=1 Tax=Glutamicibacter arilaitensis TaxID=256701 RepID=UPI003FD1B0C0
MQLQDFAYRGVDASPVKVAGCFGTPSAGLYSSSAGFPTTAWDSSNYYVDVLFETGASIELSAYGQTPLDTARSVAVATAIGATLSEHSDPATVHITVKNASGQEVAGQSAYDQSTRRATFTPDASLAEGEAYTVVLAARDLTGNDVSCGQAWSFRTMLPVPEDPSACPCGFYNDQQIPADPAVNDGTPVTLGTRFSADTDGVLNGLKFYRSPGESGAHTGWLYSATGSVIAQVQFPDDSAMGWQYAQFDSPVAIKAGTEYVGAYRRNSSRRAVSPPGPCPADQHRAGAEHASSRLSSEPQQLSRNRGQATWPAIWNSCRPVVKDSENGRLVLVRKRPRKVLVGGSSGLCSSPYNLFFRRLIRTFSGPHGIRFPRETSRSQPFQPTN